MSNLITKIFRRFFPVAVVRESNQGWVGTLRGVDYWSDTGWRWYRIEDDSEAPLAENTRLTRPILAELEARKLRRRRELWRSKVLPDDVPTSSGNK